MRYRNRAYTAARFFKLWLFINLTADIRKMRLEAVKVEDLDRGVIDRWKEIAFHTWCGAADHFPWLMDLDENFEKTYERAKANGLEDEIK